MKTGKELSNDKLYTINLYPISEWRLNCKTPPPTPFYSTLTRECIRNMCFGLVAEYEKISKQGHRGVVLKPVKCWLCKDVTTKRNFLSFIKSANIWSMLQNKNNKNVDLIKQRYKKNQQLCMFGLWPISSIFCRFFLQKSRSGSRGFFI